MTPGQRRVLWGCIFAMTFIMWYEASGVALVWTDNIPRIQTDAEIWRHYWNQISYGGLFLALGTVLTITLRRTSLPKGKDEPEFSNLDWLILAVGLGLLAGMAYRSYVTAATSIAP